jgi:addiction module HigA family antidote
MAEKMKREFEPIHPGEILLEEFLKPMGLTQYRLAKDISVPQRRISEIVHGRRAITADTALRLGRFFGMEAEFWLNLQARYDLIVAESALSGRLESEVKPRAA